jgi:hypothetical protein
MFGRTYRPRGQGAGIDWEQEFAAAGRQRAEMARVDEQARHAAAVAMVNPLGLSDIELDPVADLRRRVEALERKLNQ